MQRNNVRKHLGISKKIKNLIFLTFFCLLLTACGKNETPQTQTGTQETQLSGSETQSGETQTGTTENPTKAEDFIISPNLTNTSPTFFPVPKCNQIIALYHCIIANAPIENQPSMQQALESSVKPRHLMPDQDLRKVCDEISADENYQKVQAHYATGQNIPCTSEQEKHKS